jgi:hypothetical protein
MDQNTCVCCDNPEILPEGRQVCWRCEHQTDITAQEIQYKKKEDE